MNFRKLCNILLPLLIFFGLQADAIEGFIYQQALKQCSTTGHHKNTRPNQDDPEDNAAVVRKVNVSQAFIVEPLTGWQDRDEAVYPTTITGHHARPLNARAMQEVCYGLLFLQHLF